MCLLLRICPLTLQGSFSFFKDLVLVSDLIMNLLLSLVKLVFNMLKLIAFLFKLKLATVDSVCCLCVDISPCFSNFFLTHVFSLLLKFASCLFETLPLVL